MIADCLEIFSFILSFFSNLTKYNQTFLAKLFQDLIKQDSIYKILRENLQMQERVFNNAFSSPWFDDYLNQLIFPEEELPINESLFSFSSGMSSQNQAEVQGLTFQHQKSKSCVYTHDLIVDPRIQNTPKVSSKHGGSIDQELQIQSSSEYQDLAIHPKTRQKNSNSIKKIGRIILDHISDYSKTELWNASLHQMDSVLSRSKKGKLIQQYKKRDRFNTHHLRLLLESDNKQLANFNLKTTHRLLVKHLRKAVLISDQIQERSKLVYLNTMKCSSLRCVNPKLALRLQMSAVMR